MGHSAAQDDVVVGVDGSPESVDAAAWAADEAVRTGRRLTLVTVVRPHAGGRDPWASSADLLRGVGHRTCDPEVARLERAYPGLAVRSTVPIGSPRVELARAAQQARLTVLGLRSRHGADRALSGSVTEHLLRTTDTALVLVPRASGPDGPAAGGCRRILVLVGPHANGRAVDAALAESRLRGGEVTVVRSTRPPSHALGTPHDSLFQAAYAHTPPEGPVIRLQLLVHDGTAADFLRTAPLGPGDLVVLGRHHHAPGAGLLVDGTLDAVLVHPRCPVLVVADHPAPKPAVAPAGAAAP